MRLKVVSNSTPLIALSRIGRLGIIRELFNSIVIPKAVFLEVATDKKFRAGSTEVLEASWIQTIEVANTAVVDFLSVTVDAGESEAIALAKEIKADLLLIDDRDGRNMAESVGIAVTGTIGLLLRYYKGNQDNFKLALDELVAHGFRISREEYERVLILQRRFVGTLL